MHGQQCSCQQRPYCESPPVTVYPGFCLINPWFWPKYIDKTNEMADRKAELERKKQKLAAIREEKERRRREKESREVHFILSISHSKITSHKCSVLFRRYCCWVGVRCLWLYRINKSIFLIAYMWNPNASIGKRKGKCPVNSIWVWRVSHHNHM